MADMAGVLGHPLPIAAEAVHGPIAVAADRPHVQDAAGLVVGIARDDAQDGALLVLLLPDDMTPPAQHLEGLAVGTGNLPLPPVGVLVFPVQVLILFAA